MDRLVAPGEVVGQRVDERYQVLRVIGRRDGADVYEAEDERLERRVALHLLAEGGVDVASLGTTNGDEVLDAGDHDGRAFVVRPLAAPGLVASTGTGDDEPTEELPAVAARTAVLPLPLLPDAPEVPAPAPDGGGTSAVVRSVAGALWARWVLLVGLGAMLLLVVLVGLSARNDGLDVPTESSVPVTVEATTTTVAPTTTAPPTTERPAKEGRGHAKRDREED